MSSNIYTHTHIKLKKKSANYEIFWSILHPRREKRAYVLSWVQKNCVRTDLHLLILALKTSGHRFTPQKGTILFNAVTDNVHMYMHVHMNLLNMREIFLSPEIILTIHNLMGILFFFLSFSKA